MSRRLQLGLIHLNVPSTHVCRYCVVDDPQNMPSCGGRTDKGCQQPQKQVNRASTDNNSCFLSEHHGCGLTPEISDRRVSACSLNRIDRMSHATWSANLSTNRDTGSPRHCAN